MSEYRERMEGIWRLGQFGIIPPADIAEYSGLELMQRILDGTYPPPPIAGTLGYILTEVGEGRTVFRGWPKYDYLNPMGTVHGGWAATIMDSALAASVHTTCGKGEASTTVEFKVNLLRPIVPETGEVVCEGRVVHRGRNLAVSEATLRGPDGKVLAFGTETCSILRLPG